MNSGNICAVSPYIALVLEKAYKEVDAKKYEKLPSKVAENILKNEISLQIKKVIPKEIEEVMKLAFENKTLCGAQAQSTIALAYIELGSKENEQKWKNKAISTYENLAKVGSIKAQYELANIYDGSSGFEPEIEKRNLWYEKLLKSDPNGVHSCSYIIKLAQFNFYEKQNYLKAIEYFQKSLDQISFKKNDCLFDRKILENYWISSMTNLASSYYEGKNDQGDPSEQNYEKAFKLYLKIAKYYESADNASYTDLDHSIIQGAYRDVAFMYENGKGIQKNYNESINWYKKVISESDFISNDKLISMLSLGNIYLNLENFDYALSWYKEATKYAPNYETSNKLIESQLKEFNATQKSNNFPDSSKIYALFSKKIKTNLIENFELTRYVTTSAMNNMASVYQYELKNSLKAAYWYERAAKLGNSLAAFNLAKLYEKGLGVLKDNKEAYAWLSVAIANQLPTKELEEKATQMRDTLWSTLAIEDNINKTNISAQAESLAKDYYTIYGNLPNEKGWQE